jgi:diacylglycerol kinase (ATP)
MALLVNPTSGKGRGLRAGRLAATRLREHGVRVDEVVGSDVADAVERARRAVADGYDALVAVGGDGMVHLVLQAVAATGMPLGIVPAGSGNDFARALGLRRDDPAAAADLVATGAARTLDAGRADGTWYGGVLSSGFDSAVNERANGMAWPRGRMRYNLAILAELRVFRAVPFRVHLDGEVVEREAMLVAVGNGPSYGGGMRVCPAAQVDDGLLDVTVLARIGTVEFLRVFPSVYRGTHVRHPAVTTYRARSVRLEAGGVVAYADGERLRPLPADIECVPGALQVVAPAAAPTHVVAPPAAPTPDTPDVA